jgi:hypothetical protein
MNESFDDKLGVFVGSCGLALFCFCGLLRQAQPQTLKQPTFYRDVLPILQQHCQVCHPSGGIAPMAFESYEEARRYAGAISEASQRRSMPPWFAEKGVGNFANDPSLSEAEIALLRPGAPSLPPTR